ncbi:MAG TPA: metallophosphoesterase family protein [Candidatus Dormibacteraeota bacterium]|nr:metallophosphoesterase family protein [Candidatus Dormibacteraeota bacterium]
MTRIAFVSDPHGDLDAFECVIADLERNGPFDEILLGGDLAQGGPQPVQTIDRIRELGWPSVRGNSDDFLVGIAGGALTEEVPENVRARGEWSVEQLGPERLDYLKRLPTSIERGPFPIGRVVLVHATPWSTEEVVLPDADETVAQRMIDEAHAGLVAYGHIHMAYQRRVAAAVLMSVGAVHGSNDTDPRPAYTVVDLGEVTSVRVVRVDCPTARLRDPGSFPVRSRPGVTLVVWP